MKIKLEGLTPCHKSLIWKIHDNYFQKKGANAWVDGHIPYNITSNPCAAWQNAKLVYQAIENIESYGGLKPKETINVIEIASGLGLFGSYFIQKFRELCEHKKSDYYHRLVYYFTDYSRKNLRDIMHNELLQNLERKGTVRFAFLDATMPQSMENMMGKPIGKIQFAAIIGNYAHCCLPTIELRKDQNGFFEKQLELYLEIDGRKKNDSRDAYIRRIISDPTSEDDLLERLQEKIHYLPIPKNYWEKKEGKQIVQKATEKFTTASILYPLGSFQAIKQSLPFMKKGSIYVISDKGYTHLQEMRGYKNCSPSIHGNTVAYNVNFPLIELYVKELGLRCFRTDDVDYGIQTMVMDTADNDVVKKTFSWLFIKNNLNQESADFYCGADRFAELDENTNAMLFYKKALKIRSDDSDILFKMGNACLELKDYQQGLAYYLRAERCDHFMLNDYDFNIARAYYYLDSYREALDYYQASIEKWGENKHCYFNMALCHEELKQYKNAENCFSKVLLLDSGYDKAREGIARMAKYLGKKRTVTLKSGYQVEIMEKNTGDVLRIKAPGGRVCLGMTLSSQGSSAQINVDCLTIETPEKLKLCCDSLDIETKKDVTIHAGRDMIMQAQRKIDSKDATLVRLP